MAYHCVNAAHRFQVDAMPGVRDAVLGAVEAEGARLVTYGASRGEIMSEDMLWQPAGAEGRMRAALDKRFQAARREGHTRVLLDSTAIQNAFGLKPIDLGGTLERYAAPSWPPAAVTRARPGGLVSLPSRTDQNYCGNQAMSNLLRNTCQEVDLRRDDCDHHSHRGLGTRRRQ
ncbi:hypothetical protein O3S80_03410 [Streptomyces sp. Lzd4kr]|nr:hypothetical protein [Streptomyces sp. Lzd4kr]